MSDEEKKISTESENEVNEESQDSEQYSIPASPQDLTEPTPENTTDSEPVDVPSEAPEALEGDFEVKSNKEALSENNLEIENLSDEKVEEKPVKNDNTEAENNEETPVVEQSTEPAPETIEIPEKPSPVAEEVEIETKILSSPESHSQTNQNIQTSVNEPLPRRADKTELETLKPVEPKTSAAQMASFEPRASEVEVKVNREVDKKLEPVVQPLKEKIIYSLLPIKNLLGKANDVLRLGRRKKLDKILVLLEKKGRIKNDDVEKLLHVSDATATRYLTQLVKEGKIKKNSRGKYLYYSKI